MNQKELVALVQKELKAHKANQDYEEPWAECAITENSIYGVEGFGCPICRRLKRILKVAKELE